MYDAFISYSSDDVALAELVHARLTAAGLKVWFDKQRLKPGYDWHREIELGCDTSRVALPVLTPRWKLSEWTRFETYGAESLVPLVFEGDFADVATAPLRSHQAESIPINRIEGYDWRVLASSIRERSSRPLLNKSARLTHIRYRHDARLFVGREANLNEIHEKLFVAPTAALTQGSVQAVTALGGVGKTTLARAYAEKFWRLYAQMFWVDCRLGVAGEFARLFDVLFPDRMHADLTDHEKADLVRLEFSQREHRPRRLLVFDDALNEDAVTAWLPKTGNCHCLVTSRFTGWSPGIATSEVWVLDATAARELLLRRSDRAWSEIDDAERRACDEIATRLDGLPLALEQAAAYVRKQGRGYGFRRYLARYSEAERYFLIQQASKGSTEYPASVYSTWRATIDQLGPGSRAMLRLAALMAPTPIPVQLFVAAYTALQECAEFLEATAPTGHTPAAGDGTALDDGRLPPPTEELIREWSAALEDYSMVRPGSDDDFSVHALVQAVERHSISKDDRSAWVRQAMRAVGIFAPDESHLFENWPTWRRLLPHAEAVWERARVEAGVSPDTDLLQKMSDFLRSQGRFDAAEQLARDVLRIRRETDGQEHPDTLLAENTLGHLLLETERFDEADTLLRHVYEVRRRLLGVENRATLISAINFAGVLQYRHGPGELDEAERLLQATLQVLKRGGKADDQHYELAAINNLAHILGLRGKWDEQERLLREALDTSVRVRGFDHPYSLNVANNLAVTLVNKDDYQAAQQLLCRIIEAAERVLPPTHWERKKAEYELGELLTRIRPQQE